jgi:hypothetical protein
MEKILKSKLSIVFSGIKNRCNNPKAKDYKNYGGKGIKVCDEWRSFKAFYTWAVTNGYTIDSKLEVDRKDGSKGYSPDNCRLISKAENNRNCSRNVVTWDIVDKIRIGEYKELTNKEISSILNCSPDTIKDIRGCRTWNR